MRLGSFFRVALAATLLVAGAPGCGGRRQMAETLHTEWRGAELYRRMCAVCHGQNGEGYAADHAPRLAGRELLASVTDPALRNAVAMGRSGTTMSAWGVGQGGPLAPRDLDGIIAFMRLWQSAQSVALDERPRGGDANRGADLYQRNCAHCHGARGVGGPEVHIGSPDFLAAVSDGYLRYAIGRGRSRTPMAGFAAALGDSGVEDLVSLLRSWQSTAPPAPKPPAARPPPLPLGRIPLNPRGPDPIGFRLTPMTTPADTVKKELDRGARMALLDARAPSDYVTEHISGALSVPFYDPGPYLASLPKDVWYVCYCACPHAESGQLAQKLATAGYKKVTVLDEGIGVWRSRGYGTRGGLDP
jgi:cytochrome c oxidase cbb3-type subunit III